MEDKNIIPKDQAQAMIEKVKSLRLDVCRIAAAHTGPNRDPDGGECPGEACPLNKLCWAIIAVESKLTVMESRPLDEEAARSEAPGGKTV